MHWPCPESWAVVSSAAWGQVRASAPHYPPREARHPEEQQPCALSRTQAALDLVLSK